jgi:DNA polymerase I
MPFTVDFTEDGVLEWHLTDDGATCRTVTGYTPTVYVAAVDGDLTTVRERLSGRPDVANTARERWRRGFRRDPESVLRVDVAGVERVRPVAHAVRAFGSPGSYRPFNVDFSREFRYCLETGRDPTPERSPTTLRLSASPRALAGGPLTEIEVGDRTADGTPGEVAATVGDVVEAEDPDVLVVSAAEVIPSLYGTAADAGVDLQLGRREGYQQLAGASTYESYGAVSHSPARYNLPGRVLIDRSNTFLYGETNLAGCLDLVERSHKPLQELAWASIGNVLTAIQIREALARDVLVPWKSWRHEFFKSMSTLHEADRGGFTFAPEVGVHEDVHELDFSSLYPNVICTRNVSPDTVRCDCHDRADVPGLGYSVCDDRGYLVDVLQPLIDARDEIKAELRNCEDAERAAALEGQSDAIKWILVSCFGYQGFSNAKFGRIECHEAINAFAREILLEAKRRLEDAGWRVVHGIVDSLWVTPREGVEQRPLDAVAEAVTEATGIRLENEGAYDWIAFVPRRDGDAGALTKYFGSRRDGGYKFRGIECRQRSTPTFVAEVQREMVRALDRTRDPEVVCDRLDRHLDRLEAGSVDPRDLVVRKRASKSPEEYRHATRVVAALERSRTDGVEKRPGQSVSYVVVDDDGEGSERVQLADESLSEYDPAFYRTLLIRASESVLSPLGWRESDVEDYLASTRETSIAAFRN